MKGAGALSPSESDGRSALLRLLEQYRPIDDADRETLSRIRRFIADEACCFSRSFAAGHVTASAFLLNAGGTATLLTHHRKLNRWMQLGGHLDSETDVCVAAFREAVEESGIKEITLVSPAIFDLDIHRIPAHVEMPEHLHYDVRFLFETAESEFFTNEESHELRWVPLEDLEAYTSEWSVLRMREKLKNR